MIRIDLRTTVYPKPPTVKAHRIVALLVLSDHAAYTCDYFQLIPGLDDNSKGLVEFIEKWKRHAIRLNLHISSTGNVHKVIESSDPIATADAIYDSGK